MSHVAVAQIVDADLEESSVLSAFRRVCTRVPDRPFFTFVDDKGRDEEVVTPRELAFSAEGVARSLRAWG
jgi:acyl-CoA synthetase (AMP-forming)/AMP-acid ligase II